MYTRVCLGRESGDWMWGWALGRRGILIGRRRDRFGEFISHLQIISGLLMWKRIHQSFYFTYVHLLFMPFFQKGFEVTKKYSKSTPSSFRNEGILESQNEGVTRLVK